MKIENLTTAAAAGADVQSSPKLRDLDLATVPFGSVFSDHMFGAHFKNGRWSEGLIQPYGPIFLAPSISALHYGISVFEGLKAHKSPTGQLLLFRPRENAQRFQKSAARLAMPVVPESLFLEGVRDLVRLDHDWVPQAGAGSLYIRPVLFSTEPTIRVKPAAECQFVIFTFPFGSYFSAPVDVLVCERYARAFPGGTGDIKPAGNYAAGLAADQEAHEAGCHAVLWLDAYERRYVEECGVMNVFFVIGEEVVTPALSGTILPGITRDSVIALLRNMSYSVREERISIDDVVRLHKRGQLRECFGTGTAATVTHIGRIRYRDEIIELPQVEQRTVGPLAREKLLGIMTGCQPDPYSWVELI